MTTPLFTPEFLDRHEAKLREALPSLYVNEGEREIVSAVLIPHFREKINEIIAANDAGSSMKAQVNGMCEAIDSMLIANKELLDVDGLFAPCMQIINGVRKSVRDQLLMEGEYFRNVENVRADLEAFAAARSISIEEHNMGHKCRLVEALCSNGEVVIFRTYLKRAAIGLGLATNSGEANSKYKETLALLKNTSGIGTVTYKKMGAEYFNSKENIYHDLNAFAQAGGKFIKVLTTGPKYCYVEALCVNSEKVRFETYLKRAAVGLGLTENYTEAGSKQKEALVLLKSMSGVEVVSYEFMDEAYFKNKENIRVDLGAFAKAAFKSIEGLSTSYPREEVVCANGEKVMYVTYLRRAAIALGLATNNRNAQSQISGTLLLLKGIIAVEVVSYEKMDWAYFGNKKNIKVDLNLFAQEADTSIEKLNTGAKYSLVEVLCTNSEKVRFEAYLRRAAVGLGLAKNYNEAGSKQKETLAMLKGMIGVNTYGKMDESYFSNANNVKADLESFAKAASMSVEELNTGPKFASKEATCVNGEVVRFNTYILRAAVGLGFAADSKEAAYKPAATLALLKQLATQ